MVLLVTLSSQIRNTDDNPMGERSWTFRHPDFHAGRREALENIKRKVPAARKLTGASPPPSTSDNINLVGTYPLDFDAAALSGHALPGTYPHVGEAGAYQLGAQTAKIESIQRELASLGEFFDAIVASFSDALCSQRLKTKKSRTASGISNETTRMSLRRWLAYSGIWHNRTI